MGEEFQKMADQLVSKVVGWVQALILQLPNIAVALVILLAFYGLARLARSVVDNVMGRISDNRQIRNLLAVSSHVAVLTVGIFVALGVMDLDKTVTSLLAGAGILGLALGFAFQDLGANMISGIYMAVRRPFRIGDLIETNGYLGKVYNVSLRSSTLRTLEGQEVSIPNKQIFENAITNFTTSGERRLDLPVGVAYGDDLEAVRDIALGAVRSLEGCHRDHEPELFFTEFGDSSINFTLRVWLKETSQLAFLKVRSEAIIAVKKAFDAKGVTIPFPIRTLDFGVVGGEPLAEHMPWSKLLGKSGTPQGAEAQAGHGASPSPQADAPPAPQG